MNFLCIHNQSNFVLIFFRVEIEMLTGFASSVSVVSGIKEVQWIMSTLSITKWLSRFVNEG